MAISTRVWSAGKIVVLVGALIATYAIFTAASVRLALRAREVTVPDLANRTTGEASSATLALGLALKVDELRRPDPKIAAGRVVMQDPAAGSVARAKRTIKVWLSAGQRATLVPSLTGETERTAQLRLTQSGLALTAVAEIRSDAYPADVVVAQQPPARGAGSSVTLLVNRGAAARPTSCRISSASTASAPPRCCAGEVFGSPWSAPLPIPGSAPASCSVRIRRPVSRSAERANLARGEPVSVRIAPSILSADFAALGNAIATVERGGADLIHVDVMDGHFVPNITIGPPVVAAVKRAASVPLDVHLMIAEPDRYLDAFAAPVRR